MSANLEAKKQQCVEIAEKIKAAKSVILVSYKGMTVAEDTELRNEFRKQEVEYKVLKNTLVRKAFNGMDITDFDEALNGPTAIAFGKDESSAAKIVVEASKKYADKIVVKSGYIDGAYVDENGVKAFAAIPSKPELYAMLAGTLNGFVAGLARAIKAVADNKAE